MMLLMMVENRNNDENMMCGRDTIMQTRQSLTAVNDDGKHDNDK